MPSLLVAGLKVEQRLYFAHRLLLELLGLRGFLRCHFHCLLFQRPDGHTRDSTRHAKANLTQRAMVIIERIALRQDLAW